MIEAVSYRALGACADRWGTVVVAIVSPSERAARRWGTPERMVRILAVVQAGCVDRRRHGGMPFALDAAPGRRDGETTPTMERAR